MLRDAAHTGIDAGSIGRPAVPELRGKRQMSAIAQREAMGEVGDPCLSVAILGDAILCRAGSAGCVVAQHDVYDARNRIRANIGRASCRERVCRYVYILVVAVAL